jgi:MFS superfamily sulfate permease-like transporter
MKAVSAVILTGGLRPGEVAGAGLVMGVVLLALGLTGAISRVARFIPQSVSVGLQLGLGILMAVLGIGLILKTPWLGIGALALLFLTRIPYCPAAPIVLLAAILAGWSTHEITVPDHISLTWSLPQLVVPMWPELWRSIELAVIPQFALTITNAIIVTASLCRDLFPTAAARVSERNLALSSGLANLLLAPFGAMPMCHGVGGLQAQYGFGARTGLAPVLLGAVILVIGLAFPTSAAQLFAFVPIAAVGAFLIMAGTALATSRRLFDARASCWPVIGVTALLTVTTNPALGLAAGWGAELERSAIVRRISQRYS